MVFRLAGHLGRDVAEIEEYDVFHLQEWSAFYQLEPWGVEWWLLARLLQTLLNSFRGRGQSPVKLSEVLPINEKEQTPAEMAAIMRAMFGGPKPSSNG